MQDTDQMIVTLTVSQLHDMMRDAACEGARRALEQVGGRAPVQDHLTPAEAAERLKVTPACVRQWVTEGTLRAVRPGGRRILVPVSEVDRLLSQAG